MYVAEWMPTGTYDFNFNNYLNENLDEYNLIQKMLKCLLQLNIYSISIP